MRHLVFTVVILCSGYAYGVDYSIDHTETASVYAPQGTLMDRSARSVKTSLSVNRSDRVTVEFGPMQLQARSGTSFLKMRPEMLNLFSRKELVPHASSRLHVILAEPKALEWTGPRHVLKGSSYEDLQEGALALLADDQLEYAAVFPLAWFATKVPFMWDVREDIKPGDEVEVSFRRALDPSHLSSTDRAASLICVEKDDDTVVLESNFQRNTRGILVTWHVRVVFDTEKQLPATIIEDRFTRLVPTATDPTDKNIHIVRESLRCRLEPTSDGP